MKTNITTLDNGFKVASVDIKSANLVSLHLVVLAGSGNEREEQNGIAHFLEHMLFKGTKTRTCKEIANMIENDGGEMNAFTSKTQTQYYVTTRPEFTETAVDFLSDIALNSIIPQDELDKERGVVIQEIMRSLDNDNSTLYEKLFIDLFGHSSYGRPILGKKHNIEQFSQSNFFEFMNDYYRIDNMMLVASGKISHKKLVKLAEKYFGKQNRPTSPLKIHSDEMEFKLNNSHITKQENNQIQSTVTFPFSMDVADDVRKIQLYIVADILGGGMSSRLFEEIREKRGLVYTVSSYTYYVKDTQMFMIYAGTTPDKFDEYIKTLSSVLADLVKNGITDDELKRSKNQMISSYASRFEDRGIISEQIRSLLETGNFSTFEMYKNIINNTSLEDINLMIGEIFKNNVMMTSIGPDMEINPDSYVKYFCNLSNK